MDDIREVVEIKQQISQRWY